MPDTQPTQPQAPNVQVSLVGLTKRQQLDKTNKTIFVWVAVAAIVLTLSAVALQFIVRQGIFNLSIISAEQKTNKTLEESIQNAQGLKQNVDALIANQSLSGLRASDKDTALQVIIDALPTTGDTTSFSNSLYTKILPLGGAKISSVSVGTNTVTPVVAAPVATTAPAASGTVSALPLPFSVTFAGNEKQVKDTLLSVERVIRPIEVTQLSITVNDGTLMTTLAGQTYYLPRSTVQLGQETKKP